MSHPKLIRFSGSSALKFLLKFLASFPSRGLSSPTQAHCPSCCVHTDHPTVQVPNPLSNRSQQASHPSPLSLGKACPRQWKVEKGLILSFCHASQLRYDCKAPYPVSPTASLGYSSSPGMTEVSTWPKRPHGSLSPAFWLHLTPRGTQGLHSVALGIAYNVE